MTSRGNRYTQPWMARAGLLSLLLLTAQLGCQSGPAPQPSASAEARAVPAAARLAAVRTGLTRLADELSTLEGRLGPALAAVNWSLMRHPQCLDLYFEEMADLDLRRQSLVQTQEALAQEHAALETALDAGQVDLGAITRLDNRVQHARDQVTLMNGELATVYARTMKREAPCDAATEEDTAAR